MGSGPSIQSGLCGRVLLRLPPHLRDVALDVLGLLVRGVPGLRHSLLQLPDRGVLLLLARSGSNSGN